MGAYGSVAAGYDPGYLLRESTKGAEGYYLSAVAEIGEPPGVWTGRACPGLGLAPGGEVEPAVMEAIYGELLDPRDPAFADPQTPGEDKAHLGSAPRRYKTAAEILAARLAAEPDASPERVEQLEIEARKQARSAVLFFDFTFSADKTTSLLHASLQAAAVRAERAGEAEVAAEYARLAGEVEGAVMAGAAAAVGYLQDEAGYSRAGYHGGIPRDEHGRPLAAHATGRWVDAHDWVVAAFLQHTSRDGDPQLHVHNPILNRVQCADGAWRTLDSRAVHKARAAAAAIGGRVMDERVSRAVTVAYQQRPDLHGRELTGFPDVVKTKFSSRRTAITAGVAELAAQYTARHGKPPSARALFSMGQYVTLDSRRAKPKHEHAVPRAVTLAGWEAEMRASELGALADIPARLIGRTDPDAPAGLAGLGEEELHRIIAAAVADVQAARAVWGRSHLLAAIDAHLPGWLGGLDATGVRAVLEELTDQALAPESGFGVVDLEAAELVETPAALRRADGRSVFSPHDRALYTTRPQLDAEEQLLAAAGGHGGPRAGTRRAAAALGGTAAELAGLPGRVTAPASLAEDPPAPAVEPARRWADGLRSDQAAAVWGVLTSGRPVDILVGPAGTGKSRTMGTLSHLWPRLTGGRVVGVATAENAAQVLAAEGVGTAYNIARFLAMTARGRALLGAGDLLIVDEASMVDTAQLAALHQVAASAGAKLLLTGDPAQLQAVGAGGALAMLARRHGSYQLTTVARMAEEWERAASLRLRAGDATVLADYDRHGRISGGTAEEMATAAYRAWLADHLAGKDSLLIAATCEQATELAARARDDLISVGRVQPGDLVLRDGNTAGAGDLVQARHNDRSIRDRDGRWAANRDVWRIEGYYEDPDADEATVIVRRDLGRDPATGERQWGDTFEVPARYLRENAELAYASTVHAAEGRTVDTCHALAHEGLTRALLYVALTRGREANHIYAITATPGTRRPPHAPAGSQAGQRASADLRPGSGPAPALATPASQDTGGDEDQDAAGPAADPGRAWAPEADRLSVLIGALEREDTELPALQVLEDELARAGHLAHLGAIWSELSAEESGRRYDATLRQALTPEHYERYATEDARNTLHRLVRTAELAGHDPDELLRDAVAMRSLDSAPGRGTAADVARVLHSRVEELVGRPVPQPTSYTARAPRAADPETGRFLRELAHLMDDRVAALGEQAAADPPAWAREHLGPVPAAADERGTWVRRAATVAAYRQRYGRSDPADLIGREPDAPDARADWHTARAALGAPAGEPAAVASASTGELWARRARYERETAWAPPHVGADLRRTALARREHTTEATLARARAQAASGAERDRLQARARAHEQLARQLAAREQVLAGIDTQRARWHEATAQARQEAQEATTELRRRLPRARLTPLEPQRAGPQRERAQAPGQPGAGARAREATETDLRRAAEQAELARGILDAREARARQCAEREAQREREEPAPQRWPHRDPGYPSRRDPQPERTAAEHAAEAFPGGLGPPELLPGHRNPPERHGPRRRPPEPEIGRDGPEAGM